MDYNYEYLRSSSVINIVRYLTIFSLSLLPRTLLPHVGAVVVVRSRYDHCSRTFRTVNTRFGAEKCVFVFNEFLPKNRLVGYNKGADAFRCVRHYVGEHG